MKLPTVLDLHLWRPVLQAVSSLQNNSQPLLMIFKTPSRKQAIRRSGKKTHRSKTHVCKSKLPLTTLEKAGQVLALHGAFAMLNHVRVIGYATQFSMHTTEEVEGHRLPQQFQNVRQFDFLPSDIITRYTN